MKNEKRTCKRKGFVHTLEATIAALLVMGFILAVMPFLTYQDTTAATKEKVTNSLLVLDQAGKLDALAMAQNISGLKMELSALLPDQINFTVRLCGINCSTLDPLPQNETVKAVSRITAGYETMFMPSEIIVYFW